MLTANTGNFAKVFSLSAWPSNLVKKTVFRIGFKLQPLLPVQLDHSHKPSETRRHSEDNSEKDIQDIQKKKFHIKEEKIPFKRTFRRKNSMFVAIQRSDY